MNNLHQKEVSDLLIGRIVDTFDEVTKIYYYASIDTEKDNTSVNNYKYYAAKTNYYECLLMMYDVFLGIKELDVDEESMKKIEEKLNDLEDYLNGHGVTNEEMRRALLLLDINGFKNLNFPLDFITPDVVGTICSYLIKNIYDPSKKLSILDFNFGIGNLVYNIANNIENDTELVAVENHSLLVSVAAHKAEMMMREVSIYHQDALEYLFSGIDIVVSDIATFDYQNDKYHSRLYDEGVRYFPYLAIEKHLSLDNNPLYIYIIDNNFFSKDGNEKFKEMLKEKGSILAIIALPSSMFINDGNSKSIMIMDKKPRNLSATSLFMLPSANEHEAFIKVLDNVITHIKEYYKYNN